MKKCFEKLFMAAAILAGTILQADISEPYASVSTLPQTPCLVQDGYTLYSLAATLKAEVIIDVESQKGSVARYLAQKVKNLPSLRQIYYVNIWKSNNPLHKQLFRRFLSNVIEENTTELITPIRMTSEEASKSLVIKADLIHLGGANEQQTIYNDILSWYPHLSDTGVMCGNNWNEPSVQTGVIQAARMLDTSLQIYGNVWYFVKGS